jgi:uncharacterized membrane protein YedE/YeeE
MHLIINWQNFTPGTSLLGGMLIGLASALLVVFRGKIAGISGILGGLIDTDSTANSHRLWRGLFLIGLVSSSFVYQLFAPLPESNISASFGTLIFAGLLVGFGTRMGAGCTSGHGICGLSRLSIRSLIATISFMFSGFVVCYLFLHVLRMG